MGSLTAAAPAPRPWPPPLQAALDRRDEDALRAWSADASAEEVQSVADKVFAEPWQAVGQLRVLISTVLRHAREVPWSFLRLAGRDATFMAAAAWNPHLDEVQLDFLARKVEACFVDLDLASSTLADIVNGFLSRPGEPPASLARSVVQAGIVLGYAPRSDVQRPEFGTLARQILERYATLEDGVLERLASSRAIEDSCVIDLLARHALHRSDLWYRAVAQPFARFRTSIARWVCSHPELWRQPAVRKAALAATNDVGLHLTIATALPPGDGRELARRALATDPATAVACLAGPAQGLLPTLGPADLAPVLGSPDPGLRLAGFRLLHRLGRDAP